jgi:surface antigen
VSNPGHTTFAAHLVLPRTARSVKFYTRIQARLKRKSIRRRTIRMSLLASNAIVLAIILVFILDNPSKSAAINQAAVLNSTSTQTATANPLDQISSADIALTVARMTSLPETTAIANQAESQAADLAIIANSDDVLTKPQVVYTALKSRADISSYTTKNGDTPASLAAQFGVTSNSILWSNGLTGTTIPVSMHLVIPPVNGIVYTVKTGDTPASLAQKYNANAAQIIAYNDAEINGLQPGEQIIIPNGTPPVAATVASYSSLSAAFPWGSGPIYGSNGYDFGYCTWYVATQISVPSNWGNASSWSYYARLSGWNVSDMPTAGAIAQTADAAGGEGHVAVVTGVSEGGALIHISDMNDTGDGGGFDHVGSAWVPASEYQNFISH